jgi:uncharacterized FAD-dependent dehydrogenase
MNKYDVIIVGAGPCGYFCAYELVKKDPNKKVLMIEKGLPITKRHCPVLEHKLGQCPANIRGYNGCYPTCSITSGFGGAGAFSDGKFIITTEYGGWLGDYISEDLLMELIEYADNINLHYGATTKITDPYTEEARQIELKARGAGLKLLRSKVRHLGTEENIRILTAIYNDLSKVVEMRFNTVAQDLIIEDGVAKGVRLENGEELFADNVVLGVGREGSKWLNQVFAKYKIPMKQNRVDLGVRVECPNIIMDEINRIFYEGKFIFRASNDLLVRTFCSNPGGHVVIENYDGLVNVNGHAYNNKELRSENTNFALLVTHHFREPFNQPDEYAKRITELANQLACGSVLVQSYGDLRKGRRSTDKRIRECFTKPTLKEAVPGDLSLCLPYKTLKSIIEMIQALDVITPGIATDHTLLYGVEAKYYSAHPEITNQLEVQDVKNLFVGGDGAGITRGLAQAGASGIYIARNIIARDAIKDEKAN